MILRIIGFGDMATSINRVLGRDYMCPNYSPMTAPASPTSSSASISSSMPPTAATTLVSLNTRDFKIATRVTGIHDYKKVSNMACCGRPSHIGKTSVK